MDSGRQVIVVLQNADNALPFKPENYEVYPLETAGVSFDAVADFLKEHGANAILIDVPEMASEAIDLCRKLKHDNRDFEALPVVALLRLPTRAIVAALIDAGVDEAVLLPTTEEIISERLGRLGIDEYETETAMTVNASSPV